MRKLRLTTGKAKGMTWAVPEGKEPPLTIYAENEEYTLAYHLHELATGELVYRNGYLL